MERGVTNDKALAARDGGGVTFANVRTFAE
jgi:hypothetical protein